VVAKVEWHRESYSPVGFIVTSLAAKAKGVVHFYNSCLPCHRFVANQVRLQLFILAYNLGDFLRRLGLPKAGRDRSLQSLQLKLIKIESRVVRHARRIIFQLAGEAVPRELFAGIIERVTRLRLAPS
jgi:hypothetical protein